MDFNKFVEGLRAMGLPNERAIWLAYAVLDATDSARLKDRIGSFGMEQLDLAIRLVEAKA